MDGPTRTSRQQIMDLITGSPHSSRDLAQALRISEREIEGHLAHIERSLSRDRTRRFVLQPAVCEHCEFVFRDRTRLTRPSRCARCRSERVSAPRYEIRLEPDDR
jgi:transcriptional regulator